MRLTRFDALVDISRVGAWQYTTTSEDRVTIGAGVRHCEVERDGQIELSVPLLFRAVPQIGHFQIRSRGTVCGSIAHADPAAECPAVAVALDAQLDISGPEGDRSLPASEFFLGMWTTALDPSEVLTAVHLPRWPGRTGFAVEEVARRHGDFAIAGACVGVQLAGGRVSKAAIALFGVDSVPVRASAAEAALTGTQAGDADTVEIAQMAVAGLEPPGDLHASSQLRLRIGATTVARALTRAIEEAANA
jgi:carbon-monoxide dehydrogenase medium subunit